MRILVGLMTRGRALGAATVIGALEAFTSGQHEVGYIVSCDDDDPRTFEVMERCDSALGDRLKLGVGRRPRTLGEGWNALARPAPWDVFVHLVDDTVPLCIGWDLMVAEELTTHPITAWREMTDPDNAGNTVMSRRWYDAIGYIEPEHFPFWFGDTWVNEVHQFAFGVPIPISEKLITHDGFKRGPTTGMREVAFWFDFFARTRGLRWADGCRVASAFGRRPVHDAVTRMQAWDAWQRERCELYEKTFGGTEPANERYLAAKKRAKALLATL